MILSKLEKTSPVWLKIKAHFEGQLNLARLSNDHKTTETDTATRRGTIAAYKEILWLGEPDYDYQHDAQAPEE